ncbi:DUF3857 domain-containing protein [Polaribacter sp. PL03]|uniref:DUF3857 domain-containing protein n=1 Tax=Polaribacter sp. PL03 TaxID=3088353 RepID=UPI0029CDAFCB|nr:DUF3857 domain-containing protein [Polaribacter sp. PL03]MDX6747432.1 DUF3857 domain-containing protein [Polaribacter sp. PL03]
MNKKFYLAFITVLFTISITLSQEDNYSALTIPANLKEDANAVVRNSSIEITIENFDKMLVKKREVVTVLNKLGNVDARISEGYDLDTKITDLSVKIYNAFGKEIKKYKKRDFLDVSAVSGGTLYSDSRVKYIDYTPASYPYTVVFESEYKTSTTGFIPWWQPINGYYVSVEKSTYKINNPNKIPWRTKKTNFNDFDVKENELDTEITFSIENQPGFKYENSAVHFREILPKAIVTLNNFSLKGVPGQYKNWNEFGLWMNSKLLKGRDVLESGTVTKIKNLVEGIKDPLEKAKLVYEFMQNKTRYISVQVGIGGWEPIAANQVDKVGYGDCKGLANYTKALLDIAGVTSYYTIVYADEKRDIDKDFTSMQGNHAILNIPNSEVSGGKDIWLECTSQTMPFGFLGDFTDDRNVLVVTPKGGIIKRTTSYKDEENSQKTITEIQLNKDGSLAANLKIVSKGLQYDDKQGLVTLSEDELFKRYKSNIWSYNNNLEIETATLENDKNNIVFTEDIKATIKNYATVNDTEYLFRVNVFNKNSYVPKRYRKRKLPLKISRGYKDEDFYTIVLPEGYVLGAIPLEKEISTKFGSYKVSLKKIDETSFKYQKTIIIKEGVYSKEDYKVYRSFRKSIAKYENLRIAIIKK